MIKALVLTDVIDSTRLAAALGEQANGRLWDAHDERLARWSRDSTAPNSSGPTG